MEEALPLVVAVEEDVELERHHIEELQTIIVDLSFRLRTVETQLGLPVGQIPITSQINAKIEAMFPGLLQPQMYPGLLERLETTEVYAPEESMIFRQIVELQLRGVRQQPGPLHGMWSFTGNLYFCVPVNLLQHVDGGVLAMDNFNVNHHPFGAPRADFCMCARSAISFYPWGVWMKLQELVHQGTSMRERPLLHSALAMISVQLDSVRLQQCLN
eukprot:Skav203346  [mRNA]  locus=scaffold1076:7908:8861:+ [translate_table: standard]